MLSRGAVAALRASPSAASTNAMLLHTSAATASALHRSHGTAATQAATPLSVHVFGRSSPHASPCPSFSASLPRRSITTLRAASLQAEPTVAASASDASGQKTIALRVADPVTMLENISGRYQSAARIVMEYVDNALDDAEKMFRENSEVYPRPITIVVEIDKKRKWIRVTDNCSGMDQAQLEKLVVNVGLSGKRNSSFLNGKFGFGFHAFRAAAKRVTVHSKKADSPVLRLEVLRSQSDSIVAPYPVDDAFPTDVGTGTSVLLDDFLPEWFAEVDALAIKKEIELHFEGLLTRPNLSILVKEVTSSGAPTALAATVAEVKSHVCTPFDYNAVEGTGFVRTLTLKDEEKSYDVQVVLKVANREYPGHRARFFGVGRRIAEVAAMQSFMKQSKLKHSLWAHPQLIGYISVPSSLNPVITRDEFLQSKVRTALYSALVKIEPALKEALDKEMQSQREVALGKLETVLCKILEKLHKQDKRPSPTRSDATSKSGDPVVTDLIDPNQIVERVVEEKIETPPQPTPPENEPQPPAEAEAPPEEKPPKEDKPKKEKENAPPPFDIHFAKLPPSESGEMRRSQRVDRVITVNVAHPDFLERATHKMGRLQLNDRLASYLAEVISVQYKDDELSAVLSGHSQSEGGASSKEKYYENVLSIMSRFETAMRKNMKGLQKQLNISAKTGVEDHEQELFDDNDDAEDDDDIDDLNVLRRKKAVKKRASRKVDDGEGAAAPAKRAYRKKTAVSAEKETAVDEGNDDDDGKKKKKKRKSKKEESSSSSSSDSD